jgi:hypothetical protein
VLNLNEENSKDLIKKDTASVIKEILQNLLEGITGIAASERKDWALSIGHLFQRIRSGNFLFTLLKEWNQFREKGKIKDDYQFTEQHQECLGEILDFLDKEMPDEKRFSILKKIFLVAAMEKASSRDSLLPQQYLQISKTLSTGEILVLISTYLMAKSWKSDKSTSAKLWVEKVTAHSHLTFPTLVELHETKLIDKRLLTPRFYSDGSGVTMGEHFRLTDLGWNLCEYIDNYEQEVENEKPNTQ